MTCIDHFRCNYFDSAYYIIAHYQINVSSANWFSLVPLIILLGYMIASLLSRSTLIYVVLAEEKDEPFVLSDKVSLFDRPNVELTLDLALESN